MPEQTDARAHWEGVYSSTTPEKRSWTQAHSDPTLDMLIRLAPARDSRILDVGGGASDFVERLLGAGYRNVAVLDISPSALTEAQSRLGEASGRAAWIVADALAYRAARLFDVWRDRACFHFLTSAEDQARYVESLRASVKVGGLVLISAFAPDGPERCSGLPVQRYDAARLRATLGEGFERIEEQRETHETPWGAGQRFAHFALQRAG